MRRLEEQLAGELVVFLIERAAGDEDLDALRHGFSLGRGAPRVIVVDIPMRGTRWLLLVAIAFALVGRADISLLFAKAGVIFLMATPTVRIIAALAMYIDARDKKMIAVSFATRFNLTARSRP